MIDTESIRRQVSQGENPFKDACAVIGAMVGVIDAIYGPETSLLFLQRMTAHICAEFKREQPDHTLTEI